MQADNVRWPTLTPLYTGVPEILHAMTRLFRRGQFFTILDRRLTSYLLSRPKWTMTTTISFSCSGGRVTERCRGSTRRHIANEWGTFTSVQSATGVLIEWKPFESTKRPKFVYDGASRVDRLPAGALTPGFQEAFLTLQRMETPVIYFYSHRNARWMSRCDSRKDDHRTGICNPPESGRRRFRRANSHPRLDGVVNRPACVRDHLSPSLFGQPKPKTNNNAVRTPRIQWQQLRLVRQRPRGPFRFHATGHSRQPLLASARADAALIRVRLATKWESGRNREILFTSASA